MPHYLGFALHILLAQLSIVTFLARYNNINNKSNNYLTYLSNGSLSVKVRAVIEKGWLLAVYWDRRFFESTRGRLVTLLRREGRAVDELAADLGLTNNGVRAHLATLERDGLVRQGGSVRRGSGGKPAYVYELTSEARGMFPRAYGPVLGGLLDVLVEHFGTEELDTLLREAGARMADEGRVPSGGIRERLEAAVGVLDDLGGLAEIEEREGTFAIRSYGCPLAAVVTEQPRACDLVETLIAKLANAHVRERCERGENPRCRFEVSPADGTTGRS
jgi:predicted ArsR family transcriptional regulator